MERKTKEDAGAEKPVVRFPTQQLLASKALSGYQRDFARAVLKKPEYTVEKAVAELDRFFKGGGK